ncbi:hypothetical protein AVEN_60319-1 [Araneus ventricosus]|uniref:DDE-1 domain-containing protein n=1 Tax=Araneus ventricosus TaxID=182803 RepID=A0A4Y2GUZ7_ARAVE|nr:hypothetical protein AVEN_60319-1 [Araneus ventricosus]
MRYPTAKPCESYAERFRKKTRHAYRGNFATLSQCKASHRSSEPSFIGLFWLGSFGLPPAYSPDLAPSDFHLFRKLKHHLGGNHYKDDEDVKTAVTSWLSDQAASFYEEGIQNLVARQCRRTRYLHLFLPHPLLSRKSILLSPLCPEIPFCVPFVGNSIRLQTICLSIITHHSDSDNATFIYTMEPQMITHFVNSGKEVQIVSRGQTAHESAEPTLKRSWRKLATYLENVDQSNDSGSVNVTELDGLLKIPGNGNYEEDEVRSWLDCDADDSVFQLMSADEIIA